MARTTAEIKKIMTDAFLANETLRDIYSIPSGATWEESFSTVSLENILFFVVAACMRVMETVMDSYSEEVDYRIATSVVASVAWYHKRALEFQLGDELVLDPLTWDARYVTVDPTKRIVKYAAVRDMGTSIQVLVSGEADDKPSRLTDEQLAAFKEYMDRIKLAGVVLKVYSRDADSIAVTMSVEVDPLVIDKKGCSVADRNVKPVEVAIVQHLKSLEYGGVLNTTRLVDAIQTVQGVRDVMLQHVEYRAAAGQDWHVLSGNNYAGVSGCYVMDDEQNRIAYV